MSYSISYSMAVDLLRHYVEKMYRDEDMKVVRLKDLYSLDEEMEQFINDLQSDGHNVSLILRSIKEDLEKKYRYDKIRVEVDGAARFNSHTHIPNKSAIGFAIYGDCQLLHEDAQYIGSHADIPGLQGDPVPASNNTVEYLSLIRALEYMINTGINARKIDIYSDSKMVVTQVNMVSTTKADHLKSLRDYTHQLVAKFPHMTINLIPREENQHVDDLVNQLLDKVEAQDHEK